MANPKVYKRFDEIEAKIKSLGLNHAKLQDVSGNDLVSFNPVKKPIGPKLQEIRKKLQVIDDGLYCIVAQARFGPKIHADKFYYGKGKYSDQVEDLREAPRDRSGSSSENVLSVESALNHVQTSAQLTAENEYLKKENDSLRARITVLEGQVTKLEEENETLSEAELEEEDNGTGLENFGSYLKEIMPTLAPLADRFLDLEEKKLKAKEVKILIDGGYEVPGLKKKQPRRQAPKPKHKQIPQPGAPGWEEYLDAVDAMDDEALDAHLAGLEKHAPHIFEAVCQELEIEFEEELEEEEYQEDEGDLQEEEEQEEENDAAE